GERRRTSPPASRRARFPHAGRASRRCRATSWNPSAPLARDTAPRFKPSRNTEAGRVAAPGPMRSERVDLVDHAFGPALGEVRGEVLFLDVRAERILVGLVDLEPRGLELLQKLGLLGDM